MVVDIHDTAHYVGAGAIGYYYAELLGFGVAILALSVFWVIVFVTVGGHN